jgi:hypothetical protein
MRLKCSRENTFAQIARSGEDYKKIGGETACGSPAGSWATSIQLKKTINDRSTRGLQSQVEKKLKFSVTLGTRPLVNPLLLGS